MRKGKVLIIGCLSIAHVIQPMQLTDEAAEQFFSTQGELTDELYEIWEFNVEEELNKIENQKSQNLNENSVVSDEVKISKKRRPNKVPQTFMCSNCYVSFRSKNKLFFHERFCIRA